MITKIDCELGLDIGAVSMVQIHPDETSVIVLRGDEEFIFINLSQAKKIIEMLDKLVIKGEKMLTKINDDVAINFADLDLVKINPDNTASIIFRGDKEFITITTEAAKKIIEMMAKHD